MAFRRKTYKRRAAPKRRVYKRRAAPKRRMIKKVVNQVLSKRAEKKIANKVDLDRALLGVSPAVNFDTNNIIPLGCQTGGHNIPQGVGQSQRIGNKLRITKATIKGTIVANQYNATTNPSPVPMVAKMVFFYAKTDPNTQPTPAFSNDFYDFNNTVNGFRNDLVDQWAAINKEKYRVLGTRTFKLGFSTLERTAAGVSGTTNYANNDFKYNASFNVDYTKWIPKTQVFRDNNIDSSTRQLYLMWIISSATGGNIADGTVPAGCQYSMDMQYEDV